MKTYKTKKMNVLEKNIEDLIWDCIQDGKTEILRKRGLPIFDNNAIFLRQVNLGSYGIADMIRIEYVTDNKYYDEGIKITIIELKKGDIDFSALGQSFRYMTGIESIFTGGLCDLSKKDIKLNILLIGTSINKGDFCYSLGNMDNVSVYTTSIDLEKGVTFNYESGYRLTNESFNSVKNSDITKTANYLKEMLFKKVNGLIEDNLPF